MSDHPSHCLRTLELGTEENQSSTNKNIYIYFFNLSKGFYLRRGLSRTLNETEPFRTAQRLDSFCLELILEEKRKRGKKKEKGSNEWAAMHAQKTHSKRGIRDPGSEGANWRKESQLFLHPADGSEPRCCLHVLAARSALHVPMRARIRFSLNLLGSRTFRLCSIRLKLH